MVKNYKYKPIESKISLNILLKKSKNRYKIITVE